MDVFNMILILSAITFPYLNNKITKPPTTIPIQAVRIMVTGMITIMINITKKDSFLIKYSHFVVGIKNRYHVKTIGKIADKKKAKNAELTVVPVILKLWLKEGIMSYNCNRPIKA